MTSAAPGTSFSLSYELQPGDLVETDATSAATRRERTRIMFTLVSWVPLGAAFTAITVALDHPSVVKDSTGAPGWMYAIDGVIWTSVVFLARLAWRLSPKRRARRSWRHNPRLHGRHHDQIDSRGVTWTAPDGTQIFMPWTRMASVRETERTFILHDDNGAWLAGLPKRGLGRADLIPTLREFLNRSIAGHQHSG